MRKTGCLILLLTCCLAAEADHITGGEMYYSYNGFSNGLHHYHGTLKLFMRCNSGRQFSDPTIISVFNRGTGQRVIDLNVPLSRMETLQLNDAGPCISNPPPVCYVVGYYEFNLDLAPSAMGYVLASQVNYRIAGIRNLASNVGLIGALYSAEIPGESQISSGPANNSAFFTGSDLVVICAGNSFSYSFAARDSDGDTLRYSFCNAFQSTGGSGNGFGGSPPPTDPPPFPSVPYALPDYDGGNPLGGHVQINAGTGLITGIAPAEGVYVVTVCVEEIRNGKVMATQRKDLQINITNCSIAGASLLPEYQLCRQSTALTVTNLSSSPLIQSQLWQLRAAGGPVIATGSGSAFTYQFSDTGLYQLKLVINQNQQCADSGSAIVRVYPGMQAQFNVNGLCVKNQTLFSDSSFTRYGRIVSWLWDFGDPSSQGDSATQPQTSYQYPSPGNKSVRLMIANENGCRDTARQQLSIIDKPPISLLFRDTLICVNDSLQLMAAGSGQFSWSPLQSLRLANTATPWAKPAQSTTYRVNLNESGCLNIDSVRVRVVDHVSLMPMPDTLICAGDSLQLRLQSDALQFQWTPANAVLQPQAQQPLAFADASTRFQVMGRIGSCSASAGITVRTSPYPVADAGPDSSICFGGTARLTGRSDGSRYMWSPANAVSEPQNLVTRAQPVASTKFILTAYHDTGCPKPVSDSVWITVLPKIVPYAGNDTNVVLGQPLQLQASGGIRYHWEPAYGLSNPDIADPVGIWQESWEERIYRVTVYNELGCSEQASIRVKLFQTGPRVFVPNAFTPNNDGHNDVLRPITAGIRHIDAFRIYNRWGQLLYSASAENPGWDGRIGAQLQPAGAYVWWVLATDYTGQRHQLRGNFVLIR